MNPESPISFTCLVKINSGDRALENLPMELSGFDAARPLIITGKDAADRKALRTLIRAFGDSGMTFGLFDGVTDTTDLAVIDVLKRTCLEKDYDAIIALGGAEIVDAAKVLNVSLSLKVPDARKISAETPIRGRLRPLMVVLTAGATGLETSSVSRFEGMVFRSEYLAPNLVVIDPRLADMGDGKRIAESGLAALGRLVEAHISTDKNPFRDAYSFTAIRLIAENLKDAVAGHGGKKAATAVGNGVAMSGCVFSNTGAFLLHKLGQVVYDVRRIHPGLTMSMAMLDVLDLYRRRDGHDLAALFHPLAGDEEFALSRPEDRVDGALSLLRRLIADVRDAMGKDTPRNLREAGVPWYMMEDVLERLEADPDGPYLRPLAERMWGEEPSHLKKGQPT